VAENFVHNVVIGRRFLRETSTLDVYRHRLKDRPLQVHNTQIVAFLGDREEELKFWLDVQTRGFSYLLSFTPFYSILLQKHESNFMYS
jgi:hypothetical protein